jgi:hypothetical protein
VIWLVIGAAAYYALIAAWLIREHRAVKAWRRRQNTGWRLDDAIKRLERELELEEGL